MMRRFLVFTLILLGLTAVWPQLLAARQTAAKPDTPTIINSAPNWGTFEDLSEDASADSTRPTIQAAPNGNDITVVFTSQTTGDITRNPYFNTSSDGGDNWDGMLPIQTTGNASSNVSFAYDATGKRHAVWVETTDPGAELIYKRDDSTWGVSNSGAITLTETIIFPGLFSPQIIASGSSFLDIVWAQGDPAPVNIFHARSKDNGNNWITKSITQTSPISGNPSIAADQSGNLHAVWEEAIGGGISVIYYAMGTPNGSNNITWSDIVIISDQAVPTITNAKQPDITTDGTTVYVSFANRVAEADQQVYQLTCNSNCTSAGNWVSVNNPITTQSLGVKATDPFDVSSSIIHINNCTYAYYHGSIAGLGDDNEMILGTNSCDNWASSPMDQVTSTIVRSIFPVITNNDNGNLLLVFEQVDNEGLHTITFTKSGQSVYLPVILKQ